MSRTIRWGVLGVSGIAQEKILPALAKACNAQVDLLGSRDPAKATQVGQQFDVRRGGASYDAVIADPQIEAIYVSLPNTMHHEWIIKALDAGKAVLSDKPLTVSSAEAKSVAAKSRETGLPVMEGLMYRFHPQNRYVVEQLAAGAVGEVREVQVYNAFRLLDIMQPDNIRVWDGAGAGAIMDMGCYVVSATRMLFGAEPIAATGWLDVEPAWGGIDVGCAATLEYPGKRFAPITWSFRTGYGAGYRVIGTEAILEVPRSFIPGQAGQITQTVVIRQDRTGRRGEEKRFEPVDQFQLEFEEFSGALIEGRPPRFDVDDAVANAKALELVKALPAK
ncbi:MAG: Gfo/Idh/MocA family oxidoreductase [Bifidobacteriaceae bacterium]|jgi:predicted dehydrogenase|nr:Gfo/Idh/MocA family oxidoreductase [Bifidobacteriaceae bacterium]